MEYNEKEFFEFEKSTSIFLNSLVDFFLIEFKGNSFSAKINFNFPHRKDYQNIALNIEEISAISINQTIQSIGQQIHNYKFLIYNDSYYLSLDPDESSIELTEEDQDFFLFKKLTAHISSRTGEDMQQT